MRIHRVPASVLDGRPSRSRRSNATRASPRVRGGNAGIVRAALDTARSGGAEALRAFANDARLASRMASVAREAADAGLVVRDVLSGARTVALVYGGGSERTRERVVLCRLSRGRIREITVMEAPTKGP